MVVVTAVAGFHRNMSYDYPVTLIHTTMPTVILVSRVLKKHPHFLSSPAYFSFMMRHRKFWDNLGIVKLVKFIFY